jgi:arylformamidase
MKYYDISPIIKPSFAVFPGDVAFKLSKNLEIKEGSSCNISSMTTTLHIGSHADAPCHYNNKGKDISLQNIAYYFGNCQVLDMSYIQSNIIHPSDLENIEIKSERILIKTNSWNSNSHWKNRFKTISPYSIDFFSRKKVIMVGIDTPSVDSTTSKSLKTHKTIFQNNLSILECLSLKFIKAGMYSIIAFPLKILDGDASPVRAILLKYNVLPKLEL